MRPLYGDAGDIQRRAEEHESRIIKLDQDSSNASNEENDPSHSQIVIPQDNSLNAGAPLCPVHRSLKDRGALEVRVGNECIACSLNERQELLDLLAPFAAPDASEDTVAVLRRLTTERDALAKAALALSRAARPLSNFAYNVGQHRDDWDRTAADVKAFDAADNAVHALPAVDRLKSPLASTQDTSAVSGNNNSTNNSPASLPERFSRFAPKEQ